MRRVDSTLSQIASRNGQPSTMPAFSKALKTSHDHTTNALLPIILSFGAGLVGFVAVGVIALAVKWPISVALVASGSLMLLFLFGTTIWVIAGRLIEGKEEIWGPTVPATAAPQGKPTSWPIEMRDPETNALEWVHFKSEQLRQAAVKAAYRMNQGTPFSEGALTAGNLKITRDQFYDLRDLFFERGWCYWKDEEHHTLGVEFTRGGKRRIRAWGDLYLEMLGTPPPRISTHVQQRALPEPGVGEWEEDEGMQEGEPDEA